MPDALVTKISIVTTLLRRRLEGLATRRAKYGAGQTRFSGLGTNGPTQRVSAVLSPRCPQVLRRREPRVCCGERAYQRDDAADRYIIESRLQQVWG